jgi:integrase
VVRLGKQHYRDGLLSWRQHKGRNRNPVVIEIPVLPDLQRVMDVTPLGDLTFLTTKYGRAFSEAGFTNWFRERCNEAGLQNLSAHGLRKASATWFAERGARHIS